MAVTAHFVDEDWKLQSLVLETKQTEEAHTAKTLLHDSVELPTPLESQEQRELLL